MSKGEWFNDHSPLTLARNFTPLYLTFISNW